MIPITQNLLQTLENQSTQNFSTDLTLSCELHTELNANQCNEEEAMIPDDDGTQNLLQTLENQNTQALSCEFRTKQEQKVVSTALTLFDKSWVSSNNMRATATSISHNSIVASNAQEEEGTSSMTTLSAVSPWKITKTLTKSDIGSSSRLLLHQSLVHTHIMAFFSADSVKKIESNGLSVTVFDQDSKSDYELVFKKWHSSKSYVFNGKWHGDFVVRRELKVGDIIGLYWDPCHSKFNFRVLQTAH
ncbi:b3 domain-containing protein [Quercus suber]|uniref:B3 domain-containing protein n=1 Tax=Quercus suber TaxID=58331 RepID=A0AAW0IZB5_QUESU|nr:B3 domain-containing protein At2g33720-like [Quercus suber]POE76109.1 b3 domain-containing protein [Quercus suber]